MSESLKWARRFRLELAVEIEQLASGARTVTQITAKGPIDVTTQTLTIVQDRFAQVEKLIAAFGTARDS